ncbi:hypothetical protein HWV23_01070 [Natronomonas halophila]|uniref:DUF7547 family protein n=1 Tax=Natronomonas halophila TaxID=2747817 RepID=UPI0015B6DB2E|nr:hypothetical protein [Natronomonas halophila]QLD84355.1 hypothetical protein HWV23_01070 [Natronomonas halophila]
MDDTEPDLADAADDLAETLEALREELRTPPRGPLGLPRPPRPGELLSLTERYTIPALIALLETNVRLLELLAAAIRLAQGRPIDAETKTRLKASEFAVASGREGVDRLTAASRTTLEKLDDALADLQEAAAEGTPENPEAERLLKQARELRAEIDDRLAEVDERERTDIDVRSEDADESASESSSESVDVDAELASLKEDMDDDDEGETPNSK